MAVHPNVLTPAALAPVVGLTNALTELGKVAGGVALSPIQSLTRGFADLGKAVAAGYTQLRDASSAFARAFPLVAGGIRKVGEMVGAGLGGLAAVVEPYLKPVTQRIGIFVAAAMNPEVWLKPVTQRIGTMLAPVAAPLAGAAGAFGKAALGVSAVAAGVTGAAAGMGSLISGLVGKANPAVVMLFSRALDDLQAVIGGALTPILEVFTDLVRMAADTLGTFAGTIGGALASGLRALMPLFEILFDVVGRLGQVFGDVLTAVAPVLVVFANAVARVVKWVVEGVSELLALVGIEFGTKAAEKGSSVGAAVTGAQVGGQDDFVKKAMVSAFSLGSGGDPAKLTADATKTIAERAAKIEEWMRTLPERLWNFIKDLPAMTWEFMKQLPQLLADAIEGATSVITGTPGDRTWVGDAVDATRGGINDLGNFIDRNSNPLDWF